MSNLIYVFGMAKSSLELGTAGVRKNLELDVLRILYFINQLSEIGIKTKSFILVHDEKICTTIKEKWFLKYKFKHIDKIELLTFSHFDKEVLAKIAFEKKENKNFKNSKADFSGGITEKYLTSEIEKIYYNKKYNKVTTQHDNHIINGIKWDYFEIFEEKGSP